MQIGLALVAGAGLGFIGGCLFFRWDQGKMFGLVTQTSDSLVRSALFPGVPREAFEPQVLDPEPAEQMFETEAEEHMPAWLRSEQGPWDMTGTDDA